jgi:hypothetical protein
MESRGGEGGVQKSLPLLPYHPNFDEDVRETEREREREEEGKERNLA